ncbi:alpha-L-rhamnosidase C-terminal domain-containing protein [Arcicella sp. LKC2W]|uniref:alpha-L-rhamnosidase-related protein n=1 Tax=Arcicella sp. LKC2W TaxID=2984198 RepID=UPI002B1F361F|nr:alpha-L-rhamnosidase C-terminal domain-containing protein [Arcicella sp. LKC2W]MEA5461474.1 alpha-L-rhamnosidase C-terminal domain-containing protein [Arcicella sp. LKC2W]
MKLNISAMSYKYLKTIMFFAVLFLENQAIAQEIKTEYIQKMWSAKWITVPNTDGSKYGIYLFRKTVELDSKVSSFPIYISADNRYKLYVNGLLVGTGPAKSDLFNWNFDSIDLATYLKSGSNTIAVKVWNEAEFRPEFQITNQTGLIIQGSNNNSQVLNTDKSWKCIQDKSYEPVLVNSYAPNLPFEKTTAKGYYVAGAGEKVTMSNHIKQWEKPIFNDNNWVNAQQISPGIPKKTVGLDGGNAWRLVPSFLPQMELTKQRFQKIAKVEGITISNDFLKNGNLEIPANTKINILLDQVELTNAYPTILFSGGKNAIIRLTYAEALFGQKDKGKRNEIEEKSIIGRKDIIISDGSDQQEFNSLAYRTFRFVSLEIETNDTPLQINDLYSTFTGYPFERKANLISGNSEMKQILDIGWRTARLCANETYMDCPYYEQLQYIGDTRIQAMVTLYNSGDDRLVKNALNLMNNSRKPEGLTSSRYPTVNQQIIPTFSLWYIGMLHDYMRYGKDTDFVKNKLGGTRQILDYFEGFRDTDGSIKNLPNWFFVDWVAKWNRGMPPIGKNGNSALLDLQLLLAYQYATDLEKSLGVKELSDTYFAKSEALKTMIRNRYWDANKGLFADTPEKNIFSQHANAMAILAGIVNERDAKELGGKLINDHSLQEASIYFKYYVHSALTKAGYGNDYLSWLNIWRNHIAMGLTTWAEDTDAATTRSDCHAWGASPNIEFYRTILGIDSDGIGFSKVKIIPHLGQITDIGGSIPHPKGTISTSYKLEKGKWKIEINLPQKITGTLVWKGKTIRLKEGENKILR